MAKSILFLCGSLTPGRNGVGDYTRLLAAELIQLGVRVNLLACFDRDIDQVDYSPLQEGNIAIPCLRLPLKMQATERFLTLKGEIEVFAPDWISLQYVPHAYSTYGFPINFLWQLTRIETDASWHVMFHELWIQNNAGFLRLKRVLFSLLGQFTATYLKKSLRPGVVHTHLPHYQQLLEQKGLMAKPLPLLANIPRVPVQKDQPKDRPFRAAFFSQMTLADSIIDFLSELTHYLKMTKKQSLEIVLLGGSKKKVEATAAQLEQHLSDCRVKPVGFLSPEELSHWLQIVDLGVSPVKSHLIGKSGTVAAFLSHGLPVAAPVVTLPGIGHFDPSVRDMIFNTFSPQKLVKATQVAKSWDASGISAKATARTLISTLWHEKSVSVATALPHFHPSSTLTK